MNVIRAAVVLIALTACARTSGPVEIPAEDLPFSVERTDSPDGTGEGAESYVLYFVKDDLLVETERRLEVASRPSLVVLGALLEGPSSQDRNSGVSTEIPAEVRVLNAAVVGGDVRVDLSGEFQEPAPPERIALRVAQIVWTLTALPDVISVSFFIDGESVDVITDDGDAVQRRVSRRDYARFAPRG